MTASVYFVSDVHLGLMVGDPAEREARFVAFLKEINRPSTRALYMLGDIWDFWYEWKHTVPKGYVRVLSALMDLVGAGVKVYFFKGNHDIWTYRYFSELGMIPLDQPAFVEIGGRTFCLGHGDGLGRTSLSYRIMNWIFRNRVIQLLFSSLVHPTLAMSMGNAWSRNNRLSRRAPYEWKGPEESLYKYCLKILDTRKVDFFIFGHFHVKADDPLPGGGRLIMLDSWLFGDDFYRFVFEERL